MSNFWGAYQYVVFILLLLLSKSPVGAALPAQVLGGCGGVVKNRGAVS